jgi:anti-anti-sigma regulatory factor
VRVKAMEIKLYEFFNIDTLRHRDSARAVLDELSKMPQEEKIVIDFSGISFTSRSFCHELKRGLNGRDVIFVNMLPEVEEMMRIAFAKPQIELRAPREMKRLEELIS